MGLGLKFAGRAGLGATTALVATLFLGGAAPVRAQGAACSDDASGITVSPGFCASVFADHLGHPRHMVVGANGVLYVNTWSGRYYHNDAVPAGGFLIALQDTSGSGHADKVERFGPTQADGDHGGTGIAIYQGHLYAETNDRIVRYALARNGLTPTGAAETVVSGLPLTGDHPMHPFQIDAQGHLYVDLGSATNACQSQNRMPNVPGINPCTELETRAGTWEYDANKLNQTFSAKERFATGLRNGEGFAFDSAGRIFATQHGRDQLYENFSKYYNAEQGQNEPAEEVVQERRGSDFGWPECYYDLDQKKLMLAPEYGGDGKTVGVCAQKQEPAAAFPAHWAPNDLLIYTGNQFPAAYKDGVFVAFHGSWNRAPGPQGGYNVVFQPFANGKASGPFVVFADGFAGEVKGPSEAVHRPTGLAVGPDGALYIADDKGGRIWRVTYRGGNQSAGIAPSAPAPTSQVAAAGKVLPPEGIHPDAGAPLPVPPGGSPEQVALGERIFHGQTDGGTCSGCHGSDAKGSMTGSDLAGGKFIWSDGSVAGIIKTIDSGVPQPKEHTGAMPPKGGAQLSQTDVTAVADYVWAISHRGAH
ncbi:MAG TPA: PQQ-dependent sugar dehydrogenase [Rhodopila sp.]|nr:PQQ-dependent sugar dehydrogenase [Rhodopila sp.]